MYSFATIPSYDRRRSTAVDLSEGDVFSMPRHPVYTVLAVQKHNNTVVLAVLPRKKGTENGSYRTLHLAADCRVTKTLTVRVDRSLVKSVDLSGQIERLSRSHTYVPPTPARNCRRCGTSLDRWGFCENLVCTFRGFRQ